MRYGMMILAVAAVLAMGVVGYADSIAWRQGGGTIHGVTWTDVKCDDAFLKIRQKTAVPGGIGYGYVRARFDSSYESALVFGWAEMFTLVPPTSGGMSIVIDNAHITFYEAGDAASGVDNLMLYRITTPWLIGTPGAIDNDVCYSYKKASTSTTWSGGDWSTADFTPTNAVVVPWPDGPAGTAYPITATQLMQDLYNSGSNAGFLMIQDNELHGPAAKIGLSEAGTSEWGYYGSQRGPTLQMEYHYVPEPGTLLLLGTGALGVIGYVRRRHMK